MVNESELPINAVNHNEPKVLTGSGQNGKGAGGELSAFRLVDVASPAKRQDLTHSVTRVRQGKPVRLLRSAQPLAPEESEPQGEPTGVRVEDARKSECPPVTGGTEACALPEREADFGRVFDHDYGWS